MKEQNPQYIQRLHDLRIRLRLTQTEFAIVAGITRGCLAAWEEGRGAPWNSKALDRVCAALGCAHPAKLDSVCLIATCDEKILALHQANKDRARENLRNKIAREESRKPSAVEL